MIFCWLLWLTARGAATGDGYDVSVFTHLSGLITNSSCSIVSLTGTAGYLGLAVCEEHTESGDHWCHREVANDSDLVASTPKDKNLVCTLQEPEHVMFVTAPCKECWLHGIHPSNFTLFKARPFKPYNFSACSFSSSNQRIYFCSHKDVYHIVSIDLDGANEKIHVEKIYCYGLAVDDMNSIIFFVGLVQPIRMTSRLKDDGYEIVQRMDCRPICIATHPSTKTLFVGCLDRIVSFDYNGKHQKYLRKDRGIYALAVNPSADTLYYGTRRRLYSLTLETRVKFPMPINFPKGWDVAKYMIYAYDRVIFSCTLNPYVVIFDPKTKDFKAHHIDNAYRVPFFIVRECKS